ncbi:MAG: hypothetical protein KC613_17830, partial [Myxococcales bacterium]|nr:hypothetical protein [Myxococcales bacterium]
MRERHWIWAGAVGLMLALSACTVEGEANLNDAGPGGQGGAGGGGEVIDDVCYDGCLKLEQCGQCVGDGDCLSPEACAQVCRQTDDQAAYLCLASTNGCNEADIGACLDGSAVDACQQACGRLDGCQTCLTDANGACLDVYACDATCRQGAFEGAECLAALNTCDDQAIAACLTDDGAGDDGCADACRVLDGCGQCLLGDDGACLDVATCAETCRADWPDEGACLNDLMMCEADAIAACLTSDIGDDDCARRCTFLDGCGYCIPDADDNCLSPADCAEGCRAAEPTPYACLDALEACDEEPIIACLTGDEPIEPGITACDRACGALDGCELCWPDDEGGCMPLATCIESCGAGDPDPATAGCLANIAACGDIDACFGELPVTDCTTACAALEVCEAGFEGGTMACVMACEAAWTPGDLACYAAAGDACEAVTVCPGAPAPVEPTACDLACAGLNGCGLLPPSEDALATCVAACGGAGGEPWGDETIGCLLEAGQDCQAMQAC